ncbi:hypothetical protein GT037_010825 [Alternaria burnsii]|uniref:NmrA-like domain-containing protein n=1 Tax=Alternaria burnsii TaxID=1187904 RepID=A0A8H7AT22_9PLEO|nr:uncharacterized protein GT037_010825 [Alternaria burnsii]KAF7671044.1 hypothetical protein GT037_010825 [Alternaria burnsii]CAI9630187.1 unnamed protein product [Alternaria burnsii]
MSRVAIAGGTGGVGRTIVEELVRQGKQDVVVLSRKSNSLKGLESVPVFAVDYNDVTSTAATLRDLRIETIISTLSLFTEEVGEAQLKLIQAAIESKSVKRFAPSEFAFNYLRPGLRDFHDAAQMRIDAANMLRNSQLQFTRFVFGWILDTWNPSRAKTNLPPMTWVVDFEHRQARIPGDGMDPFTVLHSHDIAKYIAELLDDGRPWPEMSAFAGDRLSFNDMVEMAENITGKKFEVSFEPVVNLEKKDVVVLDQPEGSYDFGEGLREVTAEFGLMVVKGMMDVKADGLRNEEYPSVKPIKVKTWMQQIWGSQAC